MDRTRVLLAATYMSGNAGIVALAGSEFGGDARATVTREGEGAVLRIEGTAQQGDA